MTLDRAAERQQKAHTPSREALISAAWRYESSAEAHEQAAEAHEQAARIHDRAAKQEGGERAAHESAAAWHRAAWGNDHRAAEQALLDAGESGSG